MRTILIVGWSQEASEFAAVLEQELANWPDCKLVRALDPPGDPELAARAAAGLINRLVVVFGPGPATPPANVAAFLAHLLERPWIHPFTVLLHDAIAPEDAGLPQSLWRLNVPRPLVVGRDTSMEEGAGHLASELSASFEDTSKVESLGGSRRGSRSPSFGLPDDFDALAPDEPAGAEPPSAGSSDPLSIEPAAPPAVSAPAPAPAPAPPPEPEPVLLGASAPRAVKPGDEFTARFVAYLQSMEGEVRTVLADLSPKDAAHLGVKTCRWRRGTKATVTVSGRWLDVSPASQPFEWIGERVLLDFDCAVKPDAPAGRSVLKLDVAVDGIVVAMLRIDLEIGAARDERPASVEAAAARTAFASYSSKDRERVLDRVAAARISAGLDVFLDCLSLHPGEAWKPRLAEEIRGRDLFLLFWSADSAASQWVEWEWRTALAEKGVPGMQIHPLASGVKPPDELKDLHFGDVYMLVREAGEAKKTNPASN